MPTAPSRHLPSRSGLARVELSLTLELDPDSPTALLRTLVLLQSRRCRISEANYRSGIRGSDHLTLSVQAPPAHAHCIPAWLSALLEVRAVVAHRDGVPDSASHLPLDTDAAPAAD